MGKNTIVCFLKNCLFKRFKLIEMLKKIFNMYSLENNGNTKILTLRQFLKLSQEFFPDIDNSGKKMEMIYAQMATNKLCDFMCFVEILYKVFKETGIKKQEIDKKKGFLLFLDENVWPKYKRLVSKLYEFNIEKIQIFFQNYNPFENAVVGLFYESHDFLKHVKIFFFF